MPVFADGRIPVSVVADQAELAASLAARPGAALLAEQPPPSLPLGVVALAELGAEPSAHPAACACCAGRPPMAQALDRLFLARVKGQTKWFDRVVALLPDEPARQALASALRDDAVTASRYRPEA
ncbi:hypothetical protein [Roseomonas xinghualingensis]|uniref:hypothetical protein n=1 Tax=Roseomonas xinghualingensis TaxID=2986475 RepID=UPI0021F0F6DE|nr:hypothetical protein [Roseomonas sp. SXEYE001]MCV4207863.1 hypothetical protein [Roseomonas sp. SXEYE001]